MRIRRSMARARTHPAVESAPIDARSYVPWMAIRSPPRQSAGRLGGALKSDFLTVSRLQKCVTPPYTSTPMHKLHLC